MAEYGIKFKAPFSSFNSFFSDAAFQYFERVVYSHYKLVAGFVWKNMLQTFHGLDSALTVALSLEWDFSSNMLVLTWR